jgi:transcription-repair coupling factor (superfamily II helicase)
VDIVIGTHRLLQPDMRFKRLGLVIIDEEHRFGVRQKERLKRLRSEVDILTLTATPIPRTMNLAMAGLRDVSIIATPPQERLSVKTFVTEWNMAVVREACLREIRRGGQVFFLHNDVRTIDRTAAEIEQLVPEARVRVAHGQMPERELEAIMRDFYHQRFNLLVCTTIIESGIDIPSANTIVIQRADRFGLAQLHQFRGRVGRGADQSYCLLLAESPSADAQQRLRMMVETTDGFRLAEADLRMRGPGEFFGKRQSGLPDFRIASLLDTRLIELARSEAQRLLDGDPDLSKPEHAALAHVVARLFEEVTGEVH